MRSRERTSRSRSLRAMMVVPSRPKSKNIDLQSTYAFPCMSRECARTYGCNGGHETLH